MPLHKAIHTLGSVGGPQELGLLFQPRCGVELQRLSVCARVVSDAAVFWTFLV